MSISVSHSIILQFSNSTHKSQTSSVTGKTLHFTLNIFATCLIHFSKLPVISIIAVKIRFQRLCPETELSLSYLYSKSSFANSFLDNAAIHLLTSQGEGIPYSFLIIPAEPQLSLVGNIAEML
ncbi:MAG: hypothetical protein LBQ24_06920 [Candidatus Peribacteria bacterium]|nr:hypothetical protein [Candidatus Peribacteria bacterium]